MKTNELEKALKEGKIEPVCDAIDKELKNYIESIEGYESAKKEVSERLKEVYDGAKAAGFDVKTIRKRMNIFKGCCYCGTKEKLTMEHLMPISKGGDHSENNLFGACFSCNSSKQDRDFKEWYRKQSFYDKKREYNILQNTLAG